MCGFLISTSKMTPLLEVGAKKLKHRGPDSTVKTQAPFIVFHRLAIMDPREESNQPFKSRNMQLVCNGEIYNHKDLKLKGESRSDCTVILPLVQKHGLLKATKFLDGEFAFVIWDKKSKKLLAARDPLGIRPLFYGKTKDGALAFASEAKALVEVCPRIEAFPPGHVFDGKKLIPYFAAGDVQEKPQVDISFGIRTLLENAVHKRLEADRPLGFLLSGGLDSSLVCAIAQKKLVAPIRTFAIGIKGSAVDTKYAWVAAEYIGTDHTEVIVTEEEVLAAIPEVVRALETWDITTIRAGIGMYLVCSRIRQFTDIKVLLTGEVSDELFGYRYTDFAPSAEAFQEESVKRVSELYMYDVLRADRCISAHGLEARVPFSDRAFVEYVLSIPAAKKLNTKGIGKYLLRQAFAQSELLPESILMRPKEAFSDAVGYSLVDVIKNYAAGLKLPTQVCGHRTPKTPEAMLYRKIFDSHYPGHAALIKDYWMPNPKWPNCKVDDPSARVFAFTRARETRPKTHP